MLSHASRRDQLTALTSLATPFIEAGRREGLPVDSMLERLGLTTLTAHDPEARLGVGRLFELVELLAAESSDPLFGLRAASSVVEAASFGVLGFALRTSGTLGESVERVVRHARLMNESTRLTFVREPVPTVHDGPHPPLRWPRAYAELAMGAFFTLACKWTGRTIVPRVVGFQHGDPGLRRELERHFGCPVVFDQPTNRIAFEPATLELPFQRADPALASFLDQRLESAAHALDEMVGGLPRVRAEIARALESGTPAIDEVASSLALNPRTLQQRLAEQGTCFSAVVDSVRHEIAVAAMREGHSPVQQLSVLCGFSDERAFRRAFRRWTGRSPSSYARVLSSP